MSWVTIAEETDAPTVVDNILSEEAEFNLIRSRFGAVIVSDEGSMETVLEFVNDTHVLLKKYDGAIEIKYMLFFALKALTLKCMKNSSVEKSYTYSVGLQSLSFMPEEVEDISYIFSMARLAYDRKDYWTCVKLCQLQCFAMNTLDCADINVYHSASSDLCNKALAASTYCSMGANTISGNSFSCYYINEVPLLLMHSHAASSSHCRSTGLVDAETTFMMLQNRLNWFLFQMQCVFLSNKRPPTDVAGTNKNNGTLTVDVDCTSSNDSIVVINYFHYIRVTVLETLQDSLQKLGLPQVGSFSVADCRDNEIITNNAFAQAVPGRLLQSVPLTEDTDTVAVGTNASADDIHSACAMSICEDPLEINVAADISDGGNYDTVGVDGSKDNKENKGTEVGIEAVPVVTRRSSRHQLAAVAEEEKAPGASQTMSETNFASAPSSADHGAVMLRELKSSLLDHLGPLLSLSTAEDARDPNCNCDHELSPRKQSVAVSTLLGRLREEIHRLSLSSAVADDCTTEGVGVDVGAGAGVGVGAGAGVGVGVGVGVGASVNIHLDPNATLSVDHVSESSTSNALMSLMSDASSVVSVFQPFVDLVDRLGDGKTYGRDIPFRSFCLDVISSLAEVADGLCRYEPMKLSVYNDNSINSPHELVFPLLRRLVVHCWYGLISGSVSGIYPDCNEGLHEYVTMLSPVEAVFLLECLVDHCITPHVLVQAGDSVTSVIETSVQNRHPIDLAGYSTSVLITSVAYIVNRCILTSNYQQPYCDVHEGAGLGSEPPSLSLSLSLQCRLRWIMLHVHHYSMFGLSCQYEQALTVLTSLQRMMLSGGSSTCMNTVEVRLGMYLQSIESICPSAIENKQRFYHEKLQQLRNGEVYSRGLGLLNELQQLKSSACCISSAEKGSSCVGCQTNDNANANGSTSHVGGSSSAELSEQLLAWWQDAYIIVANSPDNSSIFMEASHSNSSSAGVSFNRQPKFSVTPSSEPVSALPAAKAGAAYQFSKSLSFLVLRVACELQSLSLWATICVKLLSCRAFTGEQMQALAVLVPRPDGCNGDREGNTLSDDLSHKLRALLALKLCMCLEDLSAIDVDAGAKSRGAVDYLAGIIHFIAASLEARVLTIPDYSNLNSCAQPCVLPCSMIQCYYLVFGKLGDNWSNGRHRGCTLSQLSAYAPAATALVRLFNIMCQNILSDPIARRMFAPTAAIGSVASGVVCDSAGNESTGPDVSATNIPMSHIVQEVMSDCRVRSHLFLFASSICSMTIGASGSMCEPETALNGARVGVGVCNRIAMVVVDDREMVLSTVIFLTLFSPVPAIEATSTAVPGLLSPLASSHSSTHVAAMSKSLSTGTVGIVGNKLAQWGMDVSQKVSLVLACAKFIFYEASLKDSCTSESDDKSSWNRASVTAPVVLSVLHFFVGMVYDQLELAEVTGDTRFTPSVSDPLTTTASEDTMYNLDILRNLRELFTFDAFSEEQVTELTDILGSYYAAHYYSFPDEHANYFEDMAELAVGMKVDARYNGLAEWYPGEIYKLRANDTYDVDFDDGDREQGIPRDFIRCRATKANLRLGRRLGSAVGTNSCVSYSDADTVSLFQYLKICDELGVYAKSKLRSGYRHLFMHSKLLQASLGMQNSSTGSGLGMLIPDRLTLVNKYMFFVPCTVPADAFLGLADWNSAVCVCSLSPALHHLLYCYDACPGDVSSMRGQVLPTDSDTCRSTYRVIGDGKTCMSLWTSTALVRRLDQMLSTFYYDFAMLGVQMSQVGPGLFHDTLCDSISVAVAESVVPNGVSGSGSGSGSESGVDESEVGEEEVEVQDDERVNAGVGTKHVMTTSCRGAKKRQRIEGSVTASMGVCVDRNQARVVPQASFRAWSCEDYVTAYVWDMCMFYKDLCYNSLRIETYEKLFDFCDDIHTALCDDIAQIILPIPGDAFTDGYAAGSNGGYGGGDIAVSSMWKNLLVLLRSEVSRSVSFKAGENRQHSCSLLYMLLDYCGANSLSRFEVDIPCSEYPGAGANEDAGDESMRVNIRSICSAWHCPDSLVTLCEAILLHTHNVVNLGSGDAGEAFECVSRLCRNSSSSSYRDNGTNAHALEDGQFHHLAQDLCVLLFMQFAVMHDLDRLGCTIVRLMQIKISELTPLPGSGTVLASQKPTAPTSDKDMDEDDNSDEESGADNSAVIENLRLRMRRVLLQSGISYYTQSQQFQSSEYSRLPTYSMPVSFGVASCGYSVSLATGKAAGTDSSISGLDMHNEYVVTARKYFEQAFRLHSLSAIPVAASSVGADNDNGSINNSISDRSLIFRSTYEFVHNDDDLDLPSCFSLFATAKLQWMQYCISSTRISAFFDAKTNAHCTVESRDRSVDQLAQILDSLYQGYIVATLKTTQGGGSPNSIIHNSISGSTDAAVVPGSTRHVSYVSHKKDEWKHCRTVALCQLQSARITTALECLGTLLADSGTGTAQNWWERYGEDMTVVANLLESYSFQPADSTSASALNLDLVSVAGIRMRLWLVVLDCLAGLRACRSSRFDLHDTASPYQISMAVVEIARLMALLQSGCRVGAEEELKWVQSKTAVFFPQLGTERLNMSGGNDDAQTPLIGHEDGLRAHDIMSAGAAASTDELSKLFVKKRVQVVAVWKLDQTNSSFDLMLRQREITYNQTRLRLVRMYVEMIVRSLDVRAAEDLVGLIPSAGSISTPTDACIARWCIVCYLTVLQRVVYRMKTTCTIDTANTEIVIESGTDVIGGCAMEVDTDRRSPLIHAGAVTARAGTYSTLILKKLYNFYSASKVGSGGGHSVKYRLSARHFELLQELMVSMLYISRGTVATAHADDTVIPEGVLTGIVSPPGVVDDTAFKLVIQGIIKVINPSSVTSSATSNSNSKTLMATTEPMSSETKPTIVAPTDNVDDDESISTVGNNVFDGADSIS